MPDTTDQPSSPAKAGAAKPARMSIAGRTAGGRGRAGRGARPMPRLPRGAGNPSPRPHPARGLGSLLGAAPRTVRMWIYAEGEKIFPRDTPIYIPIQVVSTDPDRVVTLKRPAE